ncbi:MAG TPA: phosphate signaling complex protein PhoU, partial [Candidatus Sulfotelmatobacter sp.]|nr:phosphate signaling complex protein PhoU [Candidatus Sulfotelmatobacter sp.]
MLRHFEEELDNLRSRLLEMSGLVEDSVYHSIQSLIEKDEEAAQQVIQNEAKINRMEIEIDELATSLLARVQPMATDLRFITAAIKINNDLERMGDISVNIVRRTLALMRDPLPKELVDIPHMATLAQSMIRQSLDAFVKRDAELARSILTSDDVIDQLRDSIYEQLISLMEEDSSSVR